MYDDMPEGGYECEDADEGILDESFEEGECWECEEEDRGDEEPEWSQAEDDLSRLDLTDALILGTMITGNVYEEARLNRLISRSRK